MTEMISIACHDVTVTSQCFC